MKKTILWFFTEFRFARRSLGGKWYLVVSKYDGGGIVGNVSYWTQDKPSDEKYKVIDTENH